MYGVEERGEAFPQRDDARLLRDLRAHPRRARRLLCLRSALQHPAHLDHVTHLGRELLERLDAGAHTRAAVDDALRKLGAPPLRRTRRALAAQRAYSPASVCVLLEALPQCGGHLLAFAPDDLRADHEIARAAVARSWRAVRYVPHGAQTRASASKR